MISLDVLTIYARLVLHPLVMTLLILASTYYPSIRSVFYVLAVFFGVLFVNQIFLYTGNTEAVSQIRFFVTLPVEILIVVVLMRMIWHSHSRRIQ